MAFYLHEYITQGSDEWLDWRRGVIGASDAPTIVGENPWKSPAHLMNEKLGLVPEFKGNDKTREGQRLEGPARVELERRHSTKIRPVVVQDPELPFLAASLDGLCKSNSRVYEIKCGQKAYERTRRDQEPPDYYYGQLQHVLMVTGLDSLYFAAYRPNQPMIVLEVDRDDYYIKRLRKAEEEFVSNLMKRRHNVQRAFVGVFVN